jgi:hypothetical protein
MRIVITSLAVLALVACNKAAETGNEAARATANAAGNVTEAASNAMAAVTPAGFQLNETSWTYTYKGKDQTESIDANGHFTSWVTKPAVKVVDEGTSVMKDDKACFTSTMDPKQGEECWTTKATDIGQSMDTVSDKGEKLTVTRVAYQAPPAAPAPKG